MAKVRNRKARQPGVNRTARAFPRASRSSVCGLPASYFGGVGAGVDDMAPPLLLLLSAGAAGVALESAGAAAIGAGGGAAGAAAGVAASWLLLQAESTSAAAKALRASFVFIDESPEW